MNRRAKTRPRRASTIFVALVTMFCITVLNGYHLSHPDDHNLAHVHSVAADHHSSHDNPDGDDQFVGHSALHAMSMADPVVLVLASTALFASWYPKIVAIFVSVDPPGHLRPPQG